ncbi:MAG: DUF1257 domain-containing protein [Elusimicrobia bacterium]|nr:DUF1257 domain-containing protein [Elusimicrobiota bacterium]
MSAVCVFTPAVVEVAWPVVFGLITTALTSMGYAVVKAKTETDEAEAAVSREVDLSLEQSHGFEQTLGEEEEFKLERGGVTLTFKKGADGRLHVCAAGAVQNEDELRAAGKEALNRFMQVYARQKIVTELKKRGFSLTEETLKDGTVRLKAKGR